tara:strand:- start:10 stop:198 length:189 start_codon:yes stop_codon:yes gene_type:complete
MRFRRLSSGKDDTWWSMSEEQQLTLFLQYSPFKYSLIDNKVSGIRTINFMILEEENEKNNTE